MSPFIGFYVGMGRPGDGAALDRAGESVIRRSKGEAAGWHTFLTKISCQGCLSNGRERVFFVNKELTKIDDMLAGIMHYKQGASSPYHMHKNCEHFYFIMEGKATVQSEEGTREIGPGMMVFIPAEEKHRLRALDPLFYFEFQAPNRFQTTILEGTPDDLKWDRVDGGVWYQS